jgi:AraC family transcriptional regulator
VTLVLRGAFEEQVGSHVEPAGPGSVVVKPAGVEHSDEYGRQGATTLQVSISPEDEAELRAAGHGIGGWRWMHGECSTRPLLRLLGVIERPPLSGDPGEAGTEDLFFEWLASLESACPRAGTPAPLWLARVHASLTACCLPIRELARREGVHPVHLAREFRRHYGTAPTEYRRQSRVRRAVSHISGSRRSLSEVAYEAGYADQAHMTREMRSVAGLTPLALRRLSIRA